LDLSLSADVTVCGENVSKGDQGGAASLARPEDSAAPADSSTVSPPPPFSVDASSLSYFLSLSMWGSDGSARRLQRVDAYGAYGDLVVEVVHVNALGLLIWIVSRLVIISSLFMFFISRP
jgi:hypothetical protein